MHSRIPASPFEQDEEGPFRTTDLLLLQPHHGKGATRQWWLRQLDTPLGFWTCLVAAPISAILSIIGMLVCLAFWLAHIRGSPDSPASPQFSLDCFLALGGGAVGAGGNFPRLTNPGCSKQIVSYFGKDRSGKYFEEVKAVADSAIEYFEALQSTMPGSPDQVVVFDIDETVLSNEAEWLEPQQSETSSGGHLLSTGKLGTQESSASSSSGSGGGRLLSAKEVKERAQAKDDRPALEAVRKFYQYLYSQQYSVAFITGRAEPSRNGTIANLEKAGYGKQCSPSTAGSPAWSSRSQNPCYAALHLRDVNDTRLASIYKTERRKALQDVGFVIAGSIGDQFSDLGDLCPAGWKLPNPMYTIL